MLNVEVTHMQNENPILNTIRAALEREPLINLHRWPVHLDVTDDSLLIMEGNVECIGAKKRALELAGTISDVRGVIDRLHVAPTEHKSDGEILGALETFLLDARDFNNCSLRVIRKGQTVTLREALDDDASGDILASVNAGVVTLDGWVISLSHKRLAGVMAWWVPGCHDVVDALEVLPPEQDTDDEVTDALSLVLEMDPLIPHPEQISIHTRDYVVTLEGLVSSETEKSRAEQDAWCLFAVGKVINQLAVNR
jgi:osmotically-inducible protein OsmY